MKETVTPAGALRFIRASALRVIHGGYPIGREEAFKLLEAAEALQKASRENSHAA